MTKRLVAAAGAALMAAVSVTLLASPQATLILRNGDRVRGELVDLGGGGFTIRVSGIEQSIPTNDVAVISFTGTNFPAGEINKAHEGRPFVAMRNGDLVAGRLIDIGGDNPLRLTVRTPGGNEEYSSNDVARIYFARWEGMPAASGSAGGSGGGQANLEQGGAGMSVPANQCWTNTGINVGRGQSVIFNGSGEIQLSGDANDVAGVTGSKTGRFAASAPIPSVPAGALIGRVGQGQPFGIGDQRGPLGMPGAGQLFVGINDDNCGDNRGEFRVQITAGRDRR